MTSNIYQNNKKITWLSTYVPMCIWKFRHNLAMHGSILTKLATCERAFVFSSPWQLHYIQPHNIPQLRIPFSLAPFHTPLKYHYNLNKIIVKNMSVKRNHIVIRLYTKLQSSLKIDIGCIIHKMLIINWRYYDLYLSRW